MTALSEHLDLAARAQGRVVLLPGEAGVGKTAVLDRFVDMTGSRAEVLRGWCDPLSTPARVAGLFRVVLEALTPSGTRLLLFEDVHWADEASLDLIRTPVPGGAIESTRRCPAGGWARSGCRRAVPGHRGQCVSS